MEYQPAPQELFAKRRKIYPRAVSGSFTRLRVIAGIILLAVYFALPWLSWNGVQSVLFDLPARKFHIFGLVFWPQDFLMLAFLLITAALSLFFFTALAGRLWCGYACPQTIWTDIYLRIERLIEGNRFRQMRLDKLPHTDPQKIRLKLIKHSLWLLVAVLTAFTFVAYFTPAADLLQRLLLFNLGPWESFWIFFFTLTTYGNAGWMREQVCIYMCPYARFQSAMFDDDTLIVSYDRQRGEPRGARKTSDDYKNMGLGDCVNCLACVQVCPTGIDIRAGLQYQCISCSACIDACNDVMDRIKYPRGLIRYTTQNALEGGKTRVMRTRIIIYGCILLILGSALVYNISQRTPLGLDVIHDRNQLYREARGLIENVYTLKIINMDNSDHYYAVSASGINGLQMETATNPVPVKSGTVQDIVVKLMAAEADLMQRSNEILITITAMEDPALSISRRARFLGPVRW
jgi:cytochrome c oxidase accessory protein FixG